jgi:hypothetical protein
LAPGATGIANPEPKDPAAVTFLPIRFFKGQLSCYLEGATSFSLGALQWHEQANSDFV